jgi:hypothetical protein
MAPGEAELARGGGGGARRQRLRGVAGRGAEAGSKVWSRGTQ